MSNAFAGVRYTSPSGEKLDAELFGYSPYGGYDGSRQCFELYPLDGHDSPFAITATDKLAGNLYTDDNLFAAVCATALYGYIERIKLVVR